jgi:hypothetical protein
MSSFLHLDYLYTPSSDVAADARYFVDVLGGRLGFAVEGMGARVALVELTGGPPHVLFVRYAGRSSPRPLRAGPAGRARAFHGPR